jgi:hypothetical protein
VVGWNEWSKRWGDWSGWRTSGSPFARNGDELNVSAEDPQRPRHNDVKFDIPGSETNYVRKHLAMRKEDSE